MPFAWVKQMSRIMNVALAIGVLVVARRNWRFMHFHFGIANFGGHCRWYLSSYIRISHFSQQNLLRNFWILDRINGRETDFRKLEIKYRKKINSCDAGELSVRHAQLAVAKFKSNAFMVGSIHTNGYNLHEKIFSTNSRQVNKNRMVVRA